jgi:hypothetical protein
MFDDVVKSRIFRFVRVTGAIVAAAKLQELVARSSNSLQFLTPSPKSLLPPETLNGAQN